MARVEFGTGKLSEKAKKNLGELLNKDFSPTAIPWKEAEFFAKDWGKLFNQNYNVAVSSGTSADIGALLSLYDHGAERGDEIIIPSLAWISVLNAPLAAGFTPVFVDIERETLNINPYKIEEKITSKTKAIMPVHTMGKPCEMDKIIEIANAHKLFVIEDCCEAYGGKYKDKFLGTLGDLSTVSFYMAHLIWAGEGGMVSTNNEDLANSVLAVRNHGRKSGSQYMDHFIPGLNLKMSDFHAVIGRAHIEDFWDTFNIRKRNLDYLVEQTRDLDNFAYFNNEESHEIHCPHGFSLTLKDPKFNYNKLYEYLQSKSINCKRNFGSMPTQHKGFKFLGYKLGDFPEAEYVGDNGLHMGCHQGLKKEDLDHISEVLHDYFKKFK